MKLITTLFSLFLGSLFLFAGNSLFLNSTNLFLESAHLSRTTIGFINMSYFFGAIVSSIVAHRIISRVGHTRSFSFFASLMAVGVLLHTIVSDITIWTVIRFFQGFAYYGVLMVIESWLNEKSETSIRSRIMGVYETVFYSAFTIGVLVINLASNAKMSFTISTIFLILAILPLSLTKISAPAIPAPKKISIPSLYNISPLALSGSLIGGFIVNGFISMSPSFTTSLGLDTKQTSIYIACAMLSGFLVQLPMGKFSDTYGRRIAITLSASVTSLAIVITIIAVLINASSTIYFISAILFGFGTFTIYPLSVARANDVLPNDSPNRLEISRSMLFAYSIGALASPVTLGFSMQHLGSTGFVIPFLVLSLFLARFSLSQRAIPKEERDVYVPMGATTTSALITHPVNKDNEQKP